MLCRFTHLATAQSCNAVASVALALASRTLWASLRCNLVGHVAAGRGLVLKVHCRVSSLLLPAATPGKMQGHLQPTSYFVRQHVTGC
jgi:hypothetical protein